MLSGLTHMTSLADPTTIDMKTPRINSRWSLEKEFKKLISINP